MAEIYAVLKIILFLFSENHVTNPSYESALNENTQGSNNQEGEPSLQKSDYYIEP